MKRRFWQRGATGVCACMLLAVATGADARPPSSTALTATRCGGEYCVIGGTSTLTLSESWLRKASAAGVRLRPTAPVVRKGTRITFPIARTAAGRFGGAYGSTPSAWYVSGCEVAPGGGVFHRGGLVISTRTSRFAVKALLDGPRLTLEIPPPQTWRTGHKPQAVSLVLAFSRFKVVDISAAGFKAETQVRVAARSKTLPVPPGIVGSLSLDVRVSPKITGLDTSLSCLPGPVEPLPRVKGGLLYPLLAGSVAFGQPMKDLFERLGRPPHCEADVCGWSQGPDTVSPTEELPRDGRTGLQVLFRSINFATENVGGSQLKGWQTPEGIHIGSTTAEMNRAYPGLRSGCQGGYCGAGFTTRPLPVGAGGRQARQRFGVSFAWPLGTTSVHGIAVGLVGEEGKCWIVWRHEQTLVHFEARCFGPLVSARLEPVGSSPRFATGQAGGAIRSAVDDSGVEHYVYAVDPMAKGVTAPARVAWHVECVTTGPVPDCAPGRGAGQAAWPAGTFEEWELSLDGYSARPPPTERVGASIPPLRFTAEFLGLPPFTIVISRVY